MTDKPKIQCIHFDLDSVLYIPTEFLDATLVLTVKSMIQTGLKADLKVALKKLQSIRAQDSNAENHFNQLCHHFNGNEDPIIIAAGVEKYWECKIGNMTPAPDTRIILQRLYMHYPLTIISNGRPLKQAGKMFRLGIWPFFTQYDQDLKFKQRYFYATQQADLCKPNPWLWELARQDIGFSYNRAIMVGDRYWQDIFGAKRLGMMTIKVNQGLHASESIEAVAARKIKSETLLRLMGKAISTDDLITLMQPDYTIQSLKQLDSILPAIEARLSAPPPGKTAS